MTSLLNYLSLWLIVVSADAVIGTLIYKRTVGQWWWHREPKNKAPWNFSVNADGWSLTAKDFNPLETFRKIYDDVTGKNKPIDVKINNMMKEHIDAIIINNIENTLKTDLLSNDIKNYVENQIKKYFDDMVGKNDK